MAERLSHISGVDLTRDYGPTNRVFRSADTVFVFGGVKIPNKAVSLLNVERLMAREGFDVERFVECGRQAVRVDMGLQPAVDMSRFESTKERRARLAREQAAARAQAEWDAAGPLKKAKLGFSNMISPTKTPGQAGQG